MNQNIEKYLIDILIAIQSIDNFIGENRDYFIFRDHKMMQRAVEREIEIIGEAVGRILKIETEFTLSNARDIINTRNYVIHGYDKVDDVIIWAIVIKHLPLLKEEIEIKLQNGKAM